MVYMEIFQRWKGYDWASLLRSCITHNNPPNTRHWLDVVLMLGRRRRRRATIKTTSSHCLDVVLMLGRRPRRRANIKTTSSHCLVFVGKQSILHCWYCCAKPKCSICLLYKWADTAFWSEQKLDAILWTFDSIKNYLKSATLARNLTHDTFTSCLNE